MMCLRIRKLTYIKQYKNWGKKGQGFLYLQSRAEVLLGIRVVDLQSLN